MSKRAYIVIALLVIIGVGVSLYLIPGEKELALIEYKDKIYDTEKNAYSAKDKYIQQLQEGNLSIDVVSALVDIYLQEGNVNEAINVLEAYVKEKPDDVAAREKLGQLYQYAQRPDDYLKNLEEINKLGAGQSGQQTLRTLSDIYHFNQDYEKQTEALKKLLKEKDKLTPEKYIELANLLASENKPKDAIAVLRELQKNYPQSMTFESTQLLVSLLMDTGDSLGAYGEVVAWKEAGKKPEEVARLVNVLHYRGSPELAQKVLDSYGDVNANQALFVEQVLLHVTFGKDDQAFEMLKKLHAEGRVPVELLDSFLLLALKNNDESLITELSAQITPANTSESEAISLTELAVQSNRRELLDLISKQLAMPEYLNTYPLFDIVYSLAAGIEGVDEKIQKYLTNNNPGDVHYVVIARNCARAGKTACAEDFLNKLAASENIDAPKLAAIGSIYLELHQYDNGLGFFEKHRKPDANQEVEKVWVRLAAGAGRGEDVATWLSTHQSITDNQLLADLYFLASNNHHDEFAVDMAKLLLDKSDTPAHREYLAYSYIRTGKYPEAIELLSSGGELSGNAVDTVFAALVAQAKRDPSYRDDLAQFAREQLDSDKIDQQRKMAMIYALIDVGQMDVAMPYIKRLAMTRGGEWAFLYAENLDKQGKYEDARQFWLMVARQKNTTPENKRNIAFTLLQRGYRDDALGLFGELAQYAGPKSVDVGQLLYLWGPRLDEQQTGWLMARAQAATSEQEKQEWLKLVGEYASDEALESVAAANPDALNQDTILTRYLEIKGEKKDKAAIQQTFGQMIEQGTNPELVRKVSRFLRDTGDSRLAIRGFQQLNAMLPGDEEALRETGTIAYSMADYDVSKQYLGEYLNARQNSSTPDDKAYEAYFYYAELLKRDKELDESKKYYKAAKEIIERVPAPTADMESKYAQSLVELGQKEEGYKHFEKSMAQYPADDILRADYVSALTEEKDYNRAWKVVQKPASTLAPEITRQPLQLVPGDYRGYKLVNNRRELLLVFDPNTMGKSRLRSEQVVSYDWLNYVTEGYDRTLVAAKPGWQMEVVKSADGSILVVPQKDMSEQAQTAEAQTTLRYELLKARIELESGKQYDAVDRLNKLMEQYPNDPQLMGFTANAENFTGRWARALKLLRQAEAISPENEDIYVLKRSIEREHAEHVKLDHEWRMLGDNDEQITTLEGFKSIDDGTDVGVVLKNNFLDTQNIRRSNGSTGDFDGDRQQAEVFVAHTQDDGTRYKGSLFANNDTLGLGGYFSFINQLGETLFSAEYHRPYWEFVEGTLDDATRDRIAADHLARINQKLTVDGGISVNRYNVEDGDDVASSLGIQAGATYQVNAEPFVAVVYGFDAEYELDHEDRIDATGASYRPFPFRSREVHSLGLVGNYEFNRDTRADYLVGYSYDRLGGNGPVAELRLTHDITEDVSVQGRAFYGLGAGETEDDLARVGAYIMYRY